MGADESRPAAGRRARKSTGEEPPVNLGAKTPTARLDEMTSGRIDALAVDKERLRAEVQSLQAEVRTLLEQLSAAAQENARLRESLANAESNNLLSTLLVAAGGGVISHATFTGNVARRVADVGAGVFLAGLALMLVPRVRRLVGR